jgi:hypothetical protein
MSQCEKCGGNYSKKESVYWSRIELSLQTVANKNCEGKQRGIFERWDGERWPTCQK